MEHVVWIGGPPGAGKTTVARRLARRHALRLYSADTRTWEHRRRACEAGDQAAIRWEALSPAERLRLDAHEMLRLSLHRQRGPMIVEDVLALPDSPVVVAEGSPVPAWANPPQAVWLLPSEDAQAAWLSARGTPASVAAMYRLQRDAAEEEAQEHGVRILHVDATTPVDVVVDAVEAALGDALTSPLAGAASTVAERRALLREVNEAVVEQVRGYFARPWATGIADDVVQSFVCECGDPGCQVEVERTVAEAAGGPCLGHTA